MMWSISEQPENDTQAAFRRSLHHHVKRKEALGWETRGAELLGGMAVTICRISNDALCIFTPGAAELFCVLKQREKYPVKENTSAHIASTPHTTAMSMACLDVEWCLPPYHVNALIGVPRANWCFWTGDFCRSVPWGFTFWFFIFLAARSPVHFGDLDLTRTKKRLICDKT